MFDLQFGRMFKNKSHKEFLSVTGFLGKQIIFERQSAKFVFLTKKYEELDLDTFGYKLESVIYYKIRFETFRSLSQAEAFHIIGTHKFCLVLN